VGQGRFPVKPSATTENALRRIGAWPLLERCAQTELVPPYDVISKRRTPAICRARDRLIFVLHSTLCWSYPEIGELFHMDHTTVMAAVRREEIRARGRCTNG